MNTKNSSPLLQNSPQSTLSSETPANKKSARLIRNDSSLIANTPISSNIHSPLPHSAPSNFLNTSGSATLCSDLNPYSEDSLGNKTPSWKLVKPNPSIFNSTGYLKKLANKIPVPTPSTPSKKSNTKFVFPVSSTPFRISNSTASTNKDSSLTSKNISSIAGNSYHYEKLHNLKHIPDSPSFNINSIDYSPSTSRSRSFFNKKLKQIEDEKSELSSKMHSCNDSLDSSLLLNDEYIIGSNNRDVPESDEDNLFLSSSPSSFTSKKSAKISSNSSSPVKGLSNRFSQLANESKFCNLLKSTKTSLLQNEKEIIEEKSFNLQQHSPMTTFHIPEFLSSSPPLLLPPNTSNLNSSSSGQNYFYCSLNQSSSTTSSLLVDDENDKLFQVDEDEEEVYFSSVIEKGNCCWKNPYVNLLTKEYFFDSKYSESNLHKLDILEDYFDTNYDIIDLLGHGSFADVYKVTKKQDQSRVFAIKRTRQTFTGNIDRKRKLIEVENMWTLKGNSQVIEIEEAWEQNGFLYIVMELCDRGTLQDQIRQQEYFTLNYIFEIFDQISRAIFFMHSKDIVHVDLKPENILCSSDGNFKLGDFGLSKKISKKNRDRERKCSSILFDTFSSSSCNSNNINDNTENDEYQETSTLSQFDDCEGDKIYMSPEVLEGVISKSNDIFSFGLIILELIANIELPSQGEPWQMLRRGDISLVKFDDSTDFSIVNLIKDMLNPDYKNRISIEQVIDKLKLITENLIKPES